MANVTAIPEGYRSVTPYLFVKSAANAIDYYKKVFGATERVRMPGPNATVMHAELQIGDSIVMLADEHPQMGARSPQSIGGTGSSLHLYVQDVDSVSQKAVDAGAQLLRPVKDQFYGDRSSTILDPFGHMWSIATHIEDVSPEEMRKRMAAMSSQTANA